MYAVFGSVSLNLKRNYIYLFSFMMFTILAELVCQLLMVLGIFSNGNRDNVLLGSAFLLLIPLIMILSRLTLFSKMFYLTAVSITAYTVGLILKRMYPEQVLSVGLLRGISSIVVPISLVAGMLQIAKLDKVQSHYKKLRLPSLVIYILSTIYVVALVVALRVGISYQLDVDKIMRWLNIPIYVLWLVGLCTLVMEIFNIKNISLYRRLDVVELNKLTDDIALKTKITNAMTKNFISCVAIRLQEDRCVVVAAQPQIEKELQSSSSAQECLKSTVRAFTEPMFLTKMLEFFDVATIAERLGKKNILSVDFVDVNTGKCRASLLPLSYDKEGNVIEVLGTIQHISKELLSLQEQLYLEETLIQCVRVTTTGTDFDKAIQELLGLVGEYYSADRSYIFEIDYENNKLNNTYEWCKKDVIPQIENLQNVELGDWLRWLEEFEKNGFLHISSLTADLDPDGFEATFLAEQQIESLLVVPIMSVHGKITGFIGVDNPTRRVDAEVLMKSITAFVESELREEKHKKELYNLSYRDMMTGLKNRHAYHEKIKEYNEENQRNVGVIFADINGLKKTNDTYGHQAGDDLIMEAARILKEVFTADETFRIGGDEFVVLCPDIPEDELQLKYKRLLDRIGKKEILAVGKVWIGKCTNLEKQIHIADEEMYSMKRLYHLRHQAD